MRPLVLAKESTTLKARFRKPVQKKAPEGNVIKLQVDYRTTISVRSKQALDMWMKKYPNAKVINA
ncbi:MAG TPA: hypothetical protein VL651_04970 [Bacteroidia bacterium]|nr:hypothetical protein [Bacteroidia bacterium]